MSRQHEAQTKENIEKIDIVVFVEDYIRIIRKMWVVILILALINGIRTYWNGVSSYHPFYTASATYTINILQDEFSNSNYYNEETAEQMATTAPYILGSDLFRSRVSEAMGEEGGLGNIHLDIVENTNLLTISVTDPDPEQAYRALLAIEEVYPSLSEFIVGKVTMQKLDETGIPQLPSNAQGNYLKSALKGAITGAIAGLLLAAILMITRNTIRREKDCLRRIHKKCFGTVPYLKQKRRTIKKTQLLNVISQGISQDFVEAFRMIRNKVEYTANENGYKSILVTSTLPEEGKSTIAVNLALSLAIGGSKVVLVDCDLRNPSDDMILNIKAEQGLTEYLNSDASLDELICNKEVLHLDADTDLMYISAGSAVEDASELLGSSKMGRLIEELEEKADYIILDSSPVGLLTDAGVLAQYVDAALFVIRRDYARVNKILDGMEHLAEGNVQVIGCVLNSDR